ncbi:unnamed protein product [Calicophoron daubneyi]|uniref:MARVEL domain-containing protein n=1 Tax=Calicophoron daubneyi TaxID=300641 RepID=A0AAV2TCZ6_CALDB
MFGSGSLILVASLSISFGIIPMCSYVKITDSSLTYNQKIFFAMEIVAVILMCFTLVIALVTCCNSDLDPCIGFIEVVISGIALIFYICALIFMWKFNCCSGKFSLPDTAWVFGGLLCSNYCAISAFGTIKKVAEYRR